MIYRIEAYKEIDFVSLYQKLEAIGNFCFSNNNIFVNSKATYEEFVDYIQDSKLAVSNITASNYKDIQNDIIKQWCFDILSKQELYNFEHSKKGQLQLKNVMNYLDMVEKERSEILNASARKIQTDKKGISKES